MKKVAAVIIAVFSVILCASLSACTKNPNELTLTRACYSNKGGDFWRWAELEYRTTSNKQYEITAAPLNEDDTEKWTFPAHFVYWDVEKVDGIKNVKIRVYMITEKDTDVGRLKITIKDGKKVILEQIFDYECVRVEV